MKRRLVTLAVAASLVLCVLAVVVACALNPDGVDTVV